MPPTTNIYAQTQKIVVLRPTNRLEIHSGTSGPPGPPGEPGEGSGSDGFTFFQDTPPTALLPGQTWYNTATGEAFVWFDGFWVEYAPGSGGGAGADNLAMTFVQEVPAAVWNIEHILGYYPSVFVVDSANEAVEGAIVYPSITEIELTFSAAFSGRAFLS